MSFSIIFFSILRTQTYHFLVKDYPSLYSPYSHVPHPPRTPTSAKIDSTGIPLQNSGYQSNAGIGQAPMSSGRDNYSPVRADERV